ncbi:fam-a protein [Plasmodium yoelii]|uniref:Fam-a protein n=2 Tax=Plasmodium yoelii TaxID=5861 RepID=A0AAE9WQW9_PLAYO|nr:fam-a protein [Plasmodium yoelii]WBY57080.1 fam-a protein [Plasmodium yoelii yoelii]VTZ78197.1 fam-a protein [Plasmodium yoelii]|eukprot:XP_022812087.1 fam-a protein [Plasmodium yoelii]
MNKLCIQIVLFLLSISVCVNTNPLATEPAPKKNTKLKSKKNTESKSKKNKEPKPEKLCPTPEEIYEKNKHLLCTNPEETIQAEKLMKDAVKHLKYYATNKYGYYFDGEYCHYDMLSYKKIYRDFTCIEKNQYIVDKPNKYNELLNELWDPDNDQYLNKAYVKRKIARVYTPNLVMIQQRYKNGNLERQKYFYALAAKFEISENKTVIVMTSANINDHNSKNKKPFENTIIKSANLFKTDIDSEDDIRKGKLKKAIVNIAGYIIKKKEKYIDITYVESIDRCFPNFLTRIIIEALKFFPPHK